MHKAIGIAGIHTGIGKTIVSAVLAAALDADYWKPVQAGVEDGTDSLTVKQLLAGTPCTVHPEHVVLQHAMSPHAAAALEQVSVHAEDMQLPQISRTLIMETAGGLMSPLNDHQTMLDLLKHFRIPVVLVCSNYLGSINHTMLTYEVLKQHHIQVIGLVFNGESNAASEAFILDQTRLPLLARIPYVHALTPAFIREEAHKLKPLIHTWK